ncbi:carboxypeptidase D [Sarcoptes scabiei]|nr:carboxypeptidase D [Sarcoptes scabiei]
MATMKFLSFISSSILLDWAIFLSALLIFYLYYKLNYWKRRGIDGPSPYPFIGSYLSLNKPLPLHQRDSYQKYGKLFGIFRGMQPALMIGEPKLIKRILVKDFPNFRNRCGLFASDSFRRLNLIQAENERWRRIRSILSPVFTTSKLKKTEPLISKCIISLIEDLKGKAKQKQSFDLYEEIGNFTMNVIASCAFATDINAHTESDNIFVRNAKELFDFDLIRISITFIVPQKLHEWLNWMRVPFFHMKTQEFFKNLSFFLIEQRRNDPENQPNDILQLMINARFKSIRSSTNLIDQTDSSTDLFNVEQDVDEIEQERKLFTEIVGRKYLSENEIAAQSWVFFLAGYETTASTLTYCIYELTINQNIQQKLFDEIQAVLNRNQSFDYENLINLPYLDAVLSETM